MGAPRIFVVAPSQQGAVGVGGSDVVDVVAVHRPRGVVCEGGPLCECVRVCAITISHSLGRLFSSLSGRTSLSLSPSRRAGHHHYRKNNDIKIPVKLERVTMRFSILVPVLLMFALYLADGAPQRGNKPDDRGATPPTDFLV